MTITVASALEVLSREVPVIPSPQHVPRTFQQSVVMAPNGWEVSVGYGFSHHCRNYGPPDPVIVLENTPDCEIALFTPDGGWFSPGHGDGESDGRLTWDNFPAALILPLVDAVATYRDGDPCPCPDCVRQRVQL